MKFSEFRKVVNEPTDQIVSSTGYTRQGLYGAMENPTEGFKAIIHDYISAKIEEEEARHAAHMAELEAIKNEFKPYSILSRELDQKIHFLKAR